MLIQLRQAEIVDALKQYVVKQGISLQGKTVEVSFTAGRKDAGLSADIDIEDATGLPALDADAPEGVENSSNKPSLSVVASTPAADEPKAEKESAPAPADKPQESATPPEEAAPTKTVGSLFG